MPTRSLFDRLANPNPEVGKDSGEEAMLLSIRHSLQRILNTRHGTANAAPDYGTSDLSGLLRGAEAVEAVRQEIEASIAKYEPRLRNAKVTFRRSNDLFSMHFDVVAEVLTDDGDTAAVFRSVVSPSGRIEVSSRPAEEG